MRLRFIIIPIASLALVGSASGAATNVITMQPTDKAVFGDVECTAQVEATSPEFLCNARTAPKFQVSVFSNNILVWKVGNPDTPIYSTAGVQQAQLKFTVENWCKRNGFKCKSSAVRVSKLDDHFAIGLAKMAQPERFILFKSGLRWTVLNMATDNTVWNGVPQPVRKELSHK
jgi:hypothetical protein